MAARRRKRRKFDFTFLGIVLLLVSYGLIMVFSASSASAHYLQGDAMYFIKRQFLFAVVGIIAMIIISKMNYHVFKRYALPILGIAIVMLIMVKVAGKEVNGARRWFQIGPVSLQPSEIAKFAIIVFLSNSLSKNKDVLNDFWRGFVPYLCIIGVVAGLILIEPHLSGALVVAGVGVVLLFCAGSKLRNFFYLIPPAAVALVAAIIAEPYRLKRITSFLNPFEDKLGDGWQIVQSLYAIGSGGLFGLGLGQSRQKFLYIPEPHNDFIFAIICEELGFFGALLVIVLFCLLIWRGIKIAMNAPDTFGGLLVSGIIALVAIQALVNIAVVTGSMPVTGMPLPFFSYGGSSLFFLLVEMGIVLNVSRYVEK